MTSAPPITTVTYGTIIGVSDNFTTPERVQEYAQKMLDPVFASAAAGMRPRVEVFSHAMGICVRVSVSGEGFRGVTKEERIYPVRRLMDEDQIRSAVWLQVSHLLNGLEPVLQPDESGE